MSPALKEALVQTILPNVADTGKDLPLLDPSGPSFQRDNKWSPIFTVGEPNAEGEIEI